MFELSDILGEVRRDGEYYSLKGFIQPDEPTIQKVASILSNSKDPITAAQDFVRKITRYRKQTGEFFRYPLETLEARRGDCDDSAILLASILRNYLPPEAIFAVVGSHNGGGHAWVTINRNHDYHDFRIIETTAFSDKKINESKYKAEVFFNDEYTFASTKEDEFGFLLVGKGRYNLQVK